MNYFWIIFNVLLIVALIYWMFRSYKSKKYNKILFVISVIVSVILIIPLLNGIVSNADSIIHPTPFLKLRSKNIHINGTHTKGVLYGETLSNSKVILKDADGIDDNIIVKSNGNGTFKATGLDDCTDYKVTAQKNGKKSDTLKISVGDIPESAYTKLHVNHSNSNNALIINNTDRNTITASGTSSPNAIIKFENPDDNYRVIKKVTANNNGKWAIKLNGPGTGETDKKEIEYYIEAKISNRLTNNDGAIFIENTNHKNMPKKKINKYDKYTKQLNGYVNRGNATDVSYDQTGNTVTWTGFEAWEDYSYNDLEPLITLLQAVTLRRADANNVETPNIKIILPNGQQIAHRDVGNEMKFDN